MVDYQLYSYSLCVALPLMLFFGMYFLFAKTPDKEIFDNYLRSRRTMGAALLLLAANYMVHFFLGLRFVNANAAILMNLSTYFLCYWLFASALTLLLDKYSVTRRLWVANIVMWLAFTAISSLVSALPQEGPWQRVGLAVLAAWLISYGLVLTCWILKSYHKAVRLFDDTHSDNIGGYIKWLSVFTYWAVVFGVGCGLLTFLPDSYVYLWILSSVPFYIYLFCCYINYLLFYEQVQCAFDSELVTLAGDDGSASQLAETSDAPAYFAEIAQRISDWVAQEGFTQPHITIKELADALHTNRTYLSAYINAELSTTYRGWITNLRVNYAKRQMLQFPEQKLAVVSEQSGFLSQSHFIKAFKEREGCSPAKWRKLQCS